MPRKGRLVQPRHIFPWIAAPYIEMLRILWRIERFFFLPIRYLQAWTVSAIFGVMGVLFSVALFIPRIAGTQVQASPGASQRPLIRRYDMPVLREEDLALPEGYESAPAELQIRMERTHLEDFDQNELATTFSKVILPQRSFRPRRDSWVKAINRPEEPDDEEPLRSYIRMARVREGHLAPNLIEYSYDPGVGDFRSQRERNPSLLIKKSVPPVSSPNEPLTYIITVTNTGHEPVESAVVEEYVSDINRVIDCEPRAMVSADYGHLVWDLAELQPNEERHLSVTIQPSKRRAITQETLVSFSSAPLIAETMVREPQRAVPEVPAEPEPEPVQPEVIPEAVTRPSVPGRPKLVIKFDPPNPVKIGEELEAYYTVTNVGTADATGIRLLVEVPPQLRHRFGELVEHKISRLTPNESRSALFAALAEGAGRLPLNWTLEANEVDSQSDTEMLAVLPGPPPTNSSPVRSTIPATEPTPVDDDALPTPAEYPLGGNQGIPNEVIPTIPGRLTEPSSIPSWSDPVLGNEANPVEDFRSSQPIDPVLTPDETLPFEGHGVEPPNDIVPLGTEPDSSPSTIPRDGLPIESGNGVKEQ